MLSQNSFILSELSLRQGLGATTGELILRSPKLITNVTARIAELRDEGHEIVNLSPRELRKRGYHTKHYHWFLARYAPKLIEDAT